MFDLVARDDTAPLAWRAEAIEAALEVAGELATLQASETVASHFATTRHIGAIIDLARIATRCLAVELEVPNHE